MIVPTYAYDNEIEIISGDGSFDNPYVLADYNNEIGEFIIDNYESKKGVNEGNASTYSTQIFTSSTQADSSKDVENYFTVIGYNYYYDNEIINDIYRMSKDNQLGKSLEKVRYIRNNKYGN